MGWADDCEDVTELGAGRGQLLPTKVGWCLTQEHRQPNQLSYSSATRGLSLQPRHSSETRLPAPGHISPPAQAGLQNKVIKLSGPTYNSSTGQEQASHSECDPSAAAGEPEYQIKGSGLDRKPCDLS